jgi:hypothetical protein
MLGQPTSRRLIDFLHWRPGKQAGSLELRGVVQTCMISAFLHDYFVVFRLYFLKGDANFQALILNPF